MHVLNYYLSKSKSLLFPFFFVKVQKDLLLCVLKCKKKKKVLKLTKVILVILQSKTRAYVSTAHAKNIPLHTLDTVGMSVYSAGCELIFLFKLTPLVNLVPKRHSDLNIFVKFDRFVKKIFLIFLSIYICIQ